MKNSGYNKVWSNRPPASGNPFYEKKGRLMTMVEALEMITKRRAELIKST
jgi:hypothetical protein